MTKWFLFSAVLLILTACGSDAAGPGACASSSVLGTWANGAVSVTFDDQCAFKSPACGVVGTYPATTATLGTVLINVTASSGASGCLPVGQITCAYSQAGTTLDFNCGNGTKTYTKQ